MRTRNRATMLVAVLAVANAAVAGQATAGDDVGRAASAFTLPMRGANAPLALASLRGQVVLINFWASWCKPCREEFPLLDQIYRKYKTVGLTVLGVNVDVERADAEEFLTHVPVSFPIVWDTKSNVSRLYHVTGMPSVMIVDRNGIVRWQHRAYAPGQENEYLDQVRAMLREP